MKKQDAISLLDEDGSKLGDLSEELRKDSEVVMAAVQNNGAALEHADKTLQDDKDIVLASKTISLSFLNSSDKFSNS